MGNWKVDNILMIAIVGALVANNDVFTFEEYKKNANNAETSTAARLQKKPMVVKLEDVEWCAKSYLSLTESIETFEKATTEKFDHLNGHMTEHEEKIVNMEEEIEEMQNTVATMKESKIAKLKEEILKLKMNVATMKEGKIVKLEEEIVELKMTVWQLKQENIGLKGYTNYLATEMKNLKGKKKMEDIGNKKRKTKEDQGTEDNESD